MALLVTAIIALRRLASQPMPAYDLTAPYSPKGDQPTAIEQLVKGVNGGQRYQTLLGATGTGKTFTMANVIAQTGRPALVLAHNKTLAAQLCNELREFFPENAVEYFISYYDYYQPEAYVPVSDTYIARRPINEEIDMLRHSATRSLFERRDVIVVASISCIYGLGFRVNTPRRGEVRGGGDPQHPRSSAGAGEQPIQPQRHRNRPRPFSDEGRCAGDRPRL